MQSHYTDEIVEERIWRGGVEIVSRVNWTQIARVRRSLSITTELPTGDILALAPDKSPEAVVGGLPRRRGRRRRSRAA